MESLVSCLAVRKYTLKRYFKSSWEIYRMREGPSALVGEQKGVADALGSTSTRSNISGEECLRGSCRTAVGHVGQRATYSCPANYLKADMGIRRKRCLWVWLWERSKELQDWTGFANMKDCVWVCVGKGGGSQKYQQNSPFRK